MKSSRWKPDVPIRLFIYLYIGAFVGGVLTANQLWKEERFRACVSLCGVLERHRTSQLDLQRYGLLMLKEKGLLVGVSLLAGLAGAGELLAALLSLWLGFLAGGLAAVFLLQSGVKGFLLCIAGVGTQLIFYIPAIFGFLLLMSKHRRWSLGYSELYPRERYRTLVFCILYLLALAIGVLFEMYVNSVLWTKKIL